MTKWTGFVITFGKANIFIFNEGKIGKFFFQHFDRSIRRAIVRDNYFMGKTFFGKQRGGFLERPETITQEVPDIKI